jgi:hypothetical protein
MTNQRCEKSELPIGECAGTCCRPDLAHVQLTPEVWMRNAEAAPTAARQLADQPTTGDLVQALHDAPAAGTQYEVIDMVRELCEPTKHQQPYYLTLTGRTYHHATISPPLLIQLADAVTPSGSAGAGAARPATSKPAARLDAIDTAARIEINAARWLRILRQDDDGDVVDLVRRAATHAATELELARDIRRWWTWARIATGWDLPAWQPDNTCPLCGTRGSLRVRLVEQLATCVNDPCRETWDQTTIGLLADHIRAENHEDEEAS